MLVIPVLIQVWGTFEDPLILHSELYCTVLVSILCRGERNVPDLQLSQVGSVLGGQVVYCIFRCCHEAHSRVIISSYQQMPIEAIQICYSREEGTGEEEET